MGCWVFRQLTSDKLLLGCWDIPHGGRLRDVGWNMKVLCPALLCQGIVAALLHEGGMEGKWNGSEDIKQEEQEERGSMQHRERRLESQWFGQ